MNWLLLCEMVYETLETKKKNKSIKLSLVLVMLHGCLICFAIKFKKYLKQIGNSKVKSIKKSSTSGKSNNNSCKYYKPLSISLVLVNSYLGWVEIAIAFHFLKKIQTHPRNAIFFTQFEYND